MDQISRWAGWRPGLRAAVLSVCAVISLSTAVIVAVVVSDHVSRTAVNEAVQTSETVVRGFVDPMFAGGSLQVTDPASVAHINAQLGQLVSAGRFLRIKVWSPDGTVVYSDQPELRGANFEVEEDLAEALDGETAADFSQGTADENVFERGLADRLLEMYMPIRASAGGKVIGAYEIYIDAAPIESAIAATRSDVLLIVGAMTLVLLALLFGAFSGASRLLARQNRQLRTSEQRFRSLVQNSADVHMVLGPDLAIVYESSAVERVLGYSASSRVGKSMFEGCHPDELEWGEKLAGEVMRTAGAQATAEMRFKHADASWRWVEVVLKNLLDDPAVGGVVVNYRDVTARRALEDELRHQAFHDSLTGLPNRALFMDRLGHLLSRRRRFPGPLAVLFVDLDDFKTVNDSLGHQAGDDLLVSVAGRLTQAIRAGDTIARMGGDEFAVLVEDALGTDAPMEVAQRLLDAIAAPFEVADEELFVHASIGVTVSTSNRETGPELVRNADTAMYTAKANGKNRIEKFEPSMHDAVLTRLSLKVDLEHAVDRGEFFLVYQPIIDLARHEMPGVEALLRWQHPERGIVNPDDFMPVAEETGLIVPIGKWVLEQACRQLQEWDATTSWRIRMSVNVSARQVQRIEFVDDVESTIQATGVDPRRITLEFTESALMHDTEATMNMLLELKQLGVRLAIDDFGTGYSSMNYLRRFPVDELKIDRSFVANMAREPAQLAVVRSIIKLGETLELDTVAEGIEDPAQLLNLSQLGAGFGQGFVFSQPVLPHELEAMLDPPADQTREVA